MLKTFYGVHGFGHVAVMVFFVLSGFLVGGEIVRSAVNGEFEWGSYLVRRAARIYPAFIAALALTAGLDFIGASYLDIHGIYSGHLTGPSLNTVFKDRLSADVLVGNLFMLQEITVPTYGCNGPLWSLSYEWWYYVMFPLAVVTLNSWRRCWRRSILGSLLLIALVALVGWKIAAYSAVWLLGIIPVIAPGYMPTKCWWPAMGLIGAALISRFGIAAHFVDNFVLDLAIGVFVMLLIGALGRVEHRTPTPPRLNKFLASFSYSLYVTHWPVAVFTCAGLSSVFGLELRRSPDRVAFLVYAALLAEVFLVGWAVSRLTESRTEQVRRALCRTLGISPRLGSSSVDEKLLRTNTP